MNAERDVLVAEIQGWLSTVGHTAAEPEQRRRSARTRAWIGNVRGAAGDR